MITLAEVLSKLRKRQDDRKNSVSTSSQNLPDPLNRQKSYRSSNLLGKYPTSQQLLVAYNPNKLPSVINMRDHHSIFFGNAPKLRELADTYTEDVAESWIEIMLTQLAEFSAAQDKISSEDLRPLSSVILGRYGYLKMSEFMYFITQMMSGRYERFYGSVDPMKITVCLRHFVDDMNAEKQWLRYQEECRQRLEEHERWKAEAITYDEWQRIKAEAGIMELRRFGISENRKRGN